MNYLQHFQENKDKYRLLGDRLLVELIENEEIKTEGGIVIQQSTNLYAAGTQTMHMTSQTARIILMPKPEDAIGLNDWEKALYNSLKPGDKVLVAQSGIRAYSQFPGVEQYTETKIGLTLLSNLHAVLLLDDEEEKEGE